MGPYGKGKLVSKRRRKIREFGAFLNSHGDTSIDKSSSLDRKIKQLRLKRKIDSKSKKVMDV